MRFLRCCSLACLVPVLLLLAACGAQTTATPASALPLTLPATSFPLPVTATAPSATPDPCAPENIGKNVQDLHRFMRAFDDAGAIASNTARGQLNQPVAELQKIRREAEDFQVPGCLARLKEIQIAQMNATIKTLLAFMGGQDQKFTDQGIQEARTLHDLYLMEMAQVLGMTVVVLPSSTPGPETGTPAVETAVPGGTPSPAAVEPTFSAPEGARLVTNAGPATVNLRRQPSFVESETLGLLLVGDRAVALARNADSTWILVEIPGQTGKIAWVFAKLVTLSGAAETLPVATPQP
jgi:hypothetical protein